MGIPGNFLESRLCGNCPPVRRNHPDQTQSFRVAYAEPIYPAEANGVEGEVSLEAVIGKDGRILSVGVRSGDPILANAALAAVRQWAYRPLKINGIPVEVATDTEKRDCLMTFCDKTDLISNCAVRYSPFV